MATISASDQEKMHKGFMPLLPGFKYAPFDDLAAAEALIGPHTAGFLVEPIQGEGGIRDGSQEFIAGLRALADKHGLLLIFDEVQCGVARTGSLYAYEQYGVTPDILATAKGLGGGFPLGACLATQEAARGMVFGTHGSTYGGNPLAMAAAGAVLDVVANDEFLANVRSTGARLRSRIEQFIGNYPDLFELVRGKGLMLGIRLKIEPRAFVAHLRDNHQVLTVAAGDMTMRVLPPLVIDDAHIDEFIERLSAGAASFSAAAAAP
jgi:acetylornithine/N-succinyldiaminopimelate aminotransferase